MVDKSAFLLFTDLEIQNLQQKKEWEKIRNERDVGAKK